MSKTKSLQRKVLITDKFAQEALLTLQGQDFLQVRTTSDVNLQKEDLGEVEALLIRSRTKITSDIFARAKRLQVIITATSGFDHIDLKEAQKWGVTVMFTPNANVESACQLTWALVLACTNRLMPAYKAVKAGEWRRDLLVGTELHGKTYGVIGLGRIGRRVAEIANAFGMSVIAFDPYLEDMDFRNNDCERVALEELVKRADVVSVHVPATPLTNHMLHRGQFANFNTGAILINTSRGSVINEEDLFEALQKQQLAAVGLDVFEREPLVRNSPLLTLPQVVLSPHIGANTHEAFQKASEQAAMKLIRFFVDSSTSDTLPPKAAWFEAT